MKKILVTRKLINSSEELAKKLFEVKLNKEDKILSKEELIKASEGCDAILSSITEKFDSNLISNTSGCGTTLKDYGFIFRWDDDMKKKAKKISELTKDISEYLDENVKLNFIKNKENTKGYKIAYHSACSMQHGQKIHNVPMNLIKKTGNKVFDIPQGHFCCGSAGTYNLLQNDIAEKLLKNKILNINKVNPEFIATGNIGCITQISNGTRIPILHTVEVIDWYTGGPNQKL